MITQLLDLLKDSNLIKFLAFMGSFFFLVGAMGKCWGIKEPIGLFRQLLILFVGILMLAGAATGFVKNKTQYTSTTNGSSDSTIIKKDIVQTDQHNNDQKVKGKKNQTIGHTTGNNNQNVQGNNNTLNSNNPKIVNSYREGDYTVYISYNPNTGDTTITRVKDKIIDEDEIEEAASYSLNNKTYYSLTMKPHYYVKFYDKEGNRYKFVANINEVSYHGFATQTGNSIIFTELSSSDNENAQIGSASLLNSHKILTGHLRGKDINFSL